MSSYKSQNGVLLREEPEVPVLEVPEPEAPEPAVKHYALLDDLARQPQQQPRKRSRASFTIIMVLIGLLAGWVGGISLTGAFHRSASAMDPVDEAATAPVQPQPDARPSAANVNAPGGKSARPRDAQPESQADAQLQPPRATPIADDKEQEDRAAEVPTREQTTKEIGQSAIEKILKENDKIKRGKHLKANKNEE
jgi:hypothetical protein